MEKMKSFDRQQSHDTLKLRRDDEKCLSGVTHFFELHTELQMEEEEEGSEYGPRAINLK